MTDLYGLFFQEVLYPAWESGLRRTSDAPAIGSGSNARSGLPPTSFVRFQDHELAKLLDHAFANVPDTRERFARAGVARDDVRSVDDLAKLPLLTREEATSSISRRESPRRLRSPRSTR